MAITNLGTLNKISEEQIPSGYTLPILEAFQDFQYTRKLTLSVLKSTVETATPSTTLTAIFNNATVGINKQITDILALDYLATATVSAYAILYNLTTNINQKTITDNTYLTNTPVTYECEVVLYVKSL